MWWSASRKAKKLLEAAEVGNLKNVRKLLDDHADVNFKGEDGRTAEMLKVLLDAGANTHLKNKYGQTARDLGNDEVKALFDNYGSDKALFDNYFQPKIYSIQSATGLIRQILDDIKDRSTDLVPTGSVVLNISLEVKIHRQQVLAVGVLVADVLRHTSHQDPPNEHQALLSVLKNIETYFQTNLPAFQPWTLQANANSVSTFAETISHLKEELIKATRNSISIQVLKSWEVFKKIYDLTLPK
ncbi:hypothetical protein AeMF1_017859 [Aphanomyces euteiches]|nr:hypothetical protein AeMF1_017859 [Aphanomyces euteiches]